MASQSSAAGNACQGSRGRVRTKKADASIREGRLAKAEQFAEAARTVLDLADETDAVADAFVTLAVHAGIAAGDVICCVRLGAYHYGERHQDAIALLKRADSDSAKSLGILLGMKTLAGYSDMPISREKRLRAERAMDALLATARRLSS